MIDKMLRSQTDILRWHEIFSLLSMERVEPFLHEMGLELSDISLVRSVAHSFLQDYEQIQKTYSQSPDAEARAQEEVLMQRTFGEIAQFASEDASLKLYHWGLHEFPGEGPDSARELTWEMLLASLTVQGETTYTRVPLNLPSGKLMALAQIVQDYLNSYAVFDQKIQEVERIPRTDWEEQVYADYLSECSPLDAVKNAVMVRRFRQIWGSIKLLLNTEEIEMLLKWGKSQAPYMNITPESVDLLL